jgi:hypothetical protein
MPNFLESKIYQIWGPNTDQVYYGSTTMSLSRRMTGHRTAYKRFIEGKVRYKTSSLYIIETGDARINLIENWPCDDSEQLKAREGHYIRTRPCVNKVIPGRSAAQYYVDNRETLLRIQAKYDVEHKDERAAKYDCDCGGRYTHTHKARHAKTKAHVEYFSHPMRALFA